VLRNDLSVVVLLEEGKQIILIDVALVSKPDDRRYAHLRRAREPDDCHAYAAGLR